MDHHTRPARDKLFSISLVLLACSITYFAYSLIRIGQHIPAIISQVSTINEQINQTVEKAEPLLVLAPTIVNEVGNIRELIPQVLAEVEAVRLTLPSILERVDKLDAQVGSLQKNLPEILATVNDTVVVVHETNRTVEKIIPLVPDVLTEVEKTRNEIPSYLTRVEGMIENAKGISEDAGMGAVTGFFKGIIATPFELLRGTGDLIRSSLEDENMVTDEDLKLVSKASEELLKSDEMETIHWENPTSGNEGGVTLVKSSQNKGQECKTLLFSFKAKSGKKDSVKKDVCLNDENKWQLMQ